MFYSAHKPCRTRKGPGNLFKIANIRNRRHAKISRKNAKVFDEDKTLF